MGVNLETIFDLVDNYENEIQEAIELLKKNGYEITKEKK